MEKISKEALADLLQVSKVKEAFDVVSKLSPEWEFDAREGSYSVRPVYAVQVFNRHNTPVSESNNSRTKVHHPREQKGSRAKGSAASSRSRKETGHFPGLNYVRQGLGDSFDAAVLNYIQNLARSTQRAGYIIVNEDNKPKEYKFDEPSRQFIPR